MKYIKVTIDGYYYKGRDNLAREEFQVHEAVKRGKIILTERFLDSLPVNDDKRLKECHELIEKIYRVQVGDDSFDKIGKGSQRGTKFKAMGDTRRYKFRSNKKNRVIYTFGRELKNIPEEFGNSIVFLAYVREHDKQDLIARCIKDVSSEDCVFDLIHLDEKERNHVKQVAIYDMESILKYRTDSQFLLDEKKFIELCSQKELLLDAVLNRQQEEVARAATLPLLLMGCAGSGKTLIGIEYLYNRMLTSHTPQRTAYFSLSERLVKNSAEKFKNKFIHDGLNGFLKEAGKNSFSMDKNTVTFYDLRAFCEQQLVGKVPALIHTYNQFEGQFYDQIIDKKRKARLAKLGISSMDLYQEIRGIIKGFLDEDWSWNKWIGQDELLIQMEQEPELVSYKDKKSLIKKLRDKKYLITPCKDQKLLSLNTKKVIEDEKEDENQNENQVQGQDIKQFLIKQFFTFDFSRPELSEEEYLTVKANYCMFGVEERSIIYEIYGIYKRWIEEENQAGTRIRMDDNDLACAALKNMEDTGDLFDYLVLDEIQDFTEKQLYFLKYLTKNKDQILFMGDIHQSILMSGFNQSRLGIPYHPRLNNEILKRNYRSQKYITDLANTIAQIRQKKTLSKSLETEMQQESVCDGIMPFHLQFDKKNLKDLIKRIAQMAGAMIVLDSEESRVQFMKEYQLDEEGEFNIFTVQEAKGLERNHVLCYNMLSAHEQDWEDIFDGKAKKNPKYTFVFNLFYVAITRTSQFLYLFDEKNTVMYEAIQEHFQGMDAYDEQGLFLNIEESIEIRIRTAKELEENHLYKKAANLFHMAKCPLDESRCLSRLHIENQEYEKALYQAVIAATEEKNSVLFAEIKDRVDDKEMKVIAEVLSAQTSMAQLNASYGKADILESLNRFADKYRCEKAVAQRLYHRSSSYAKDATNLLDNMLKEARTNKWEQ